MSVRPPETGADFARVRFEVIPLEGRAVFSGALFSREFFHFEFWECDIFCGVGVFFVLDGFYFGGDEISVIR